MKLKRTRKVLGWIAKKFDDLYTHPIDRENREREAHLNSPKGQEELRQENLAALKKEIKVNASKGDLDKVEAGLEALITISGEDKPSPEEIKDTLYTAGKNHAAVAYANNGVDLENLASTIGTVSALSRNLNEEFDSGEFITFVHRKLVDNAKTHLKRIIRMPNSANMAYAAAQKGEEILELANYTPEEKQEQVADINRLLIGAFLPNLKELAYQGLVTEFEDISEKAYEALDKANRSPAERMLAETVIEIYKGKCYNEHYRNHVQLFVHNVISLEDLSQVVYEHNRIWDTLNISEANRKKNKLLPFAGFTANTYRIGINQLLDSLNTHSNGRPKASKKRIITTLRKVQDLASKAELDEQGLDVIHTQIRAIKTAAGYWSNGNGHSNGHNSGDRNDRKNQMYKNPQLDRRARQFTKKHR